MNQTHHLLNNKWRYVADNNVYNQLKLQIQMQKRLSKQQHQQYLKTISSRINQTDHQTSTLCLQYYLAYKQACLQQKNSTTDLTNDKIPLAFKCAFYMAEKSQYSINMKGQKLRGISFSLNTLLKDHKLDDTMFMLKQMTRKIKFIDEDTSIYLNNIVKQISFLITLHLKFEKTFSQKLQLKDRTNDGGTYSKTFISYAWLLFIVVKNQVLKRSLELLPNTCMVAHIISTILILSWQYIKPQALMRDKRLHENSSQRDIKRIIKQKILQIFWIKDLTQYTRIAQLFEKYFNQMLQKNLFKMSQDKFDFLNPQNININYRKLDKYYQKILNLQYLDQRIFFKQRTLNLTPSKFTPFARQGYINKFQKNNNNNNTNNNNNNNNNSKVYDKQKPNKQQNFTSHRILNYQTVQKQIQNKTQPIHGIKLPKNLIQSPAMVKIPQIISTPISLCMQMHNYLTQKKKKINTISIHSTRSFDKQVINLINKIFHLAQKNQNYDTNSHLIKQEMIVALYRIFCEDYLITNTHQKDTPQLMKSFLGVSIQLVFFVSNLSLKFSEIQQQLNFQPFQMWKAISYFLNSDKSIPQPIKIHFLDLQVDFISYKIWENYDMVLKLSNFGNKSPKQLPQTQSPTTQKLFKRTVHQIAFQITRLTNLLQLDQQTSQKIFDLMKQIVINHSNLLYRRHLDQLIMCSIYSVCKMSNIEMKFNTILQYYAITNPNLKDIINDIKSQVYLSQQQKSSDIITFYNTIFIKNQNIKQFIKQNNNTQNSLPNLKNPKKNALLMSPLNTIIPKQITCKSKNFISNLSNTNKNKNGMTPQTQLLYAYSQSPILKYQINNFNKTIKSKKIINFAEEEEICKKKQIQQGTINNSKSTGIDNSSGMPNHSSTNNYQAITSQYITKKFTKKPPNPTNPQQPLSSPYPPQSLHPSSQQPYLPQQTITKQNQNPTSHPSTSHRNLFSDITLDKKDQNPKQNPPITPSIDQPKYRNKVYQFGTYK